MTRVRSRPRWLARFFLATALLVLAVVSGVFVSRLG
jgi:hypothetical protein